MTFQSPQHNATRSDPDRAHSTPRSTLSQSSGPTLGRSTKLSFATAPPSRTPSLARYASNSELRSPAPLTFVRTVLTDPGRILFHNGRRPYRNPYHWRNALVSCGDQRIDHPLQGPLELAGRLSRTGAPVASGHPRVSAKQPLLRGLRRTR